MVTVGGGPDMGLGMYVRMYVRIYVGMYVRCRVALSRRGRKSESAGFRPPRISGSRFIGRDTAVGRPSWGGSTAPTSLTPSLRKRGGVCQETEAVQATSVTCPPLVTFH